MKKHVTQMSKGEVTYLINRFKSLPRNTWKFNGYSKNRFETRGVDSSVFNSIWTEGFDLIEFHKHDKDGTNRILLRSIKVDKKDNQVCAVFNFTTKEVTTVYLNYRLNKHSNLVWEEYDKSLDIKKLMKS